MSAFAFFYICAPLIYKIFNKFWKIFGVTIFLMLVNSYMINITFNMFSKIGNVSGADMLAGGANKPAIHFLVRMYGLFC
jgi:hypothetical protein